MAIQCAWKNFRIPIWTIGKGSTSAACDPRFVSYTLLQYRISLVVRQRRIHFPHPSLRIHTCWLKSCTRYGIGGDSYAFVQTDTDRCTNAIENTKRHLNRLIDEVNTTRPPSEFYALLYPRPWWHPYGIPKRVRRRRLHTRPVHKVPFRDRFALSHTNHVFHVPPPVFGIYFLATERTLVGVEQIPCRLSWWLNTECKC